MLMSKITHKQIDNMLNTECDTLLVQLSYVRTATHIKQNAIKVLLAEAQDLSDASWNDFNKSHHVNEKIFKAECMVLKFQELELKLLDFLRTSMLKLMCDKIQKFGIGHVDVQTIDLSIKDILLREKELVAIVQHEKILKDREKFVLVPNGLVPKYKSQNLLDFYFTQESYSNAIRSVDQNNENVAPSSSLNQAPLFSVSSGTRNLTHNFFPPGFQELFQEIKQQQQEPQQEQQKQALNEKKMVLRN